mmetsp:Transcript_2160/g.5480  ORF Transcript_2160/g.5480 Transcript_2160/m.5480 type:complete len:119 (-) Transcript_2160:739-1095(-)
MPLSGTNLLAGDDREDEGWTLAGAFACTPGCGLGGLAAAGRGWPEGGGTGAPANLDEATEPPEDECDVGVDRGPLEDGVTVSASAVDVLLFLRPNVLVLLPVLNPILDVSAAPAVLEF